MLYVTEYPALADDARLCVSEIVTNGRGLVLVDALAASWGSTISGGLHGPDVKSVWFTLVE